jgi:hypothetical protein
MITTEAGDGTLLRRWCPAGRGGGDPRPAGSSLRPVVADDYISSHCWRVAVLTPLRQSANQPAGLFPAGLTRAPRLVSCGTRVHTMPYALATSIAHTRAATCSYAASGISSCTAITRYRPPSPFTVNRRAARGASVGTGNSDQRARGSSGRPFRSRPHHQTGAQDRVLRPGPASTGSPTNFHVARRPHG